MAGGPHARPGPACTLSPLPAGLLARPVPTPCPRYGSPAGVAALAHAAGLCLGGAWGDARYRLTLLLAPEVALQRCWADSDALFGGVRDWGARPIPLRHPVSFYYGHVAAFARLKMLPQVGRQRRCCRGGGGVAGTRRAGAGLRSQRAAAGCLLACLPAVLLKPAQLLGCV